MKKLILSVIMFLSAIAFAHKPAMNVTDLKNGTFEFSASYGPGESTEGVEVLVVKDKPYNGTEDSFDGNQILYIRKLEKNEKVTLYKPFTKKWYIVFAQGEGHIFEIYDMQTKTPLTEAEREQVKKLLEQDKSITATEKENILGK